jgi:hypothetical protein
VERRRPACREEIEMKRHEKAPNGHFAQGLILYGNLETGAMASQGFLIEPPDLQHASVNLQNDYQDKLRIFLATLGPNQRAQLQWTCNSDYKKELVRYHQQTALATDEYVRLNRQERFGRYWQRMVDRTLRREQLVLFISQDIEVSANLIQGKVGLLDYYDKTLRQLRSSFDELGISHLRRGHDGPADVRPGALLLFQEIPQSLPG